MGLDGISINQLRVDSQLNSNINKINQETSPQFIDALTKSQRVNPDEKQEQNSKNNQTLKQQEQEDEENQTQDENESEHINTEIEKFDLSDTKKYILKVDEKANEILIVEKATQKIIQKFNPEALSNLTGYLSNYTGVLINRKY